MKKKILLVIVALFIGLFAFDEVKAANEFNCLYETNYGIFKVRLGAENAFYGISYINNSGKEIPYNKKYRTSDFTSYGCPNDISILYDKTNDVLLIGTGYMAGSSLISQTFQIDGQNVSKSSCSYYGSFGNLYVAVANATTTQPVIFNYTVSSSNSGAQTTISNQIDVTVDFGAGECPSKIYPKVYGWNDNSTIIDGGIYDNTVLTGVKHYIKLGSSSKLIKGVFCGSGEGKITDIPAKIPELTSMMFNIVQIAVPIILVIMGSIDLFKGITSGKEDEMKKGRQMFIKRLVVGVIIFLVVVIVKLIISVVADTGVANMVDCIDCFISNDCGGM